MEECQAHESDDCFALGIRMLIGAAQDVWSSQMCDVQFVGLVGLEMKRGYT